MWRAVHLIPLRIPSFSGVYCYAGGLLDDAGDDDDGDATCYTDGHSEARSPATLVDLCLKALCLRWMAVPPRANAAYRTLPEELRERVAPRMHRLAALLNDVWLDRAAGEALRAMCHGLWSGAIHRAVALAMCTNGPECTPPPARLPALRPRRSTARPYAARPRPREPRPREPRRPCRRPRTGGTAPSAAAHPGARPPGQRASGARSPDGTRTVAERGRIA